MNPGSAILGRLCLQGEYGVTSKDVVARPVDDVAAPPSKAPCDWSAGWQREPPLAEAEAGWGCGADVFGREPMASA